MRTPIGDAVGLEATRICGLAMRAVAREPDAAARNQMALGSMMAGLAMNISEAGTEHALGEPLGTLYHLPHGLTIGLVLAETMDVDRRAVPERFERVADALGAPPDGTRDGSRAVRAVREILAETGFPTMREAGVRDEDVELLAVPGPRGVDPGRAGAVVGRRHRRRLPRGTGDRAALTTPGARRSAGHGGRSPRPSARSGSVRSGAIGAIIACAASVKCTVPSSSM